MSMPRDTVFHVGEPAHNLIPPADSAIWYPIHDSSLLAGIDLLPTLSEVVIAGSATGSKWSTPGVYTFPDDNGGTNEVILRATDDIDDLYLDSVMTFVGASAGEHRIICMEASYDAALSTSSALWCYGRASASSTYYGLELTSGEVPRFSVLARASGGSSSPSLSVQTGTFTSLRGNGVFACVLGIRLVTDTTDALELRASNGTQSCYYASSADHDLLANAGTHPPGHPDGQSMATFLGLALGGRNSSSGSADLNWGNGANNTGMVGNFSARRFGSYSASRVTDALAFMLARKRDYPRNLSSDY